MQKCSFQYPAYGGGGGGGGSQGSVDMIVSSSFLLSVLLVCHVRAGNL